MANINLLSSTSRVEVPFIIATIGGKTFGYYNKSKTAISTTSGRFDVYITDYPNYMQSLDIVKINGSVNTYTLNMVYMIRPGDDPNLLEKVFSEAKQDRKMILTYGDAALPAFVYKEEVTLITSIKSQFNMQTNSITYTISAVSQSVKLNAGTYNFPAVKAKPSDKIIELLYNQQYNLLQVFTGMWDKDKVLTKGLIAADDVSVDLKAKMNITVLEYFNYLVSCMRSIADDSSSVKKTNTYVLTVIDDVSGEWNGTYFTIKKMTANKQSISTLDTYEIDIGYQGSNIVTSFNITDNETYSILYDYSGEVSNQSDYVHKINDDGKIERIFSPNITRSKELNQTTEAEKTWWSNITQYPISAQVTLKGLLKPALLMTYVRLNVLFFGRKHISSGLYIVTKQTDKVSSSGYQTTLNLTRIGKDID